MIGKSSFSNATLVIENRNSFHTAPNISSIKQEFPDSSYLCAEAEANSLKPQEIGINLI
jgi:hypothetical protein